MTLLQETLEKLSHHDKKESDVIRVQTRYIQTSWDNFKAGADHEYGPDCKKKRVDPFLCIIGNDWWLERYLMDQDEYWEYKEIPRPVEEGILIEDTIFIRNWWLER